LFFLGGVGAAVAAGELPTIFDRVVTRAMADDLASWLASGGGHQANSNHLVCPFCGLCGKGRGTEW